MVLQAFIDESGTRNQDVCLVMAGFISPAEKWATFSDEWQQCLDSSPTINMFKMRHAANNPSGAFGNWRREDVHEKVHALVEIIKRNVNTAIHCTTPIHAFDSILGVDLAGPFSNPYMHTFHAIMAGIGFEAIDQQAESLELIFDEQDKYAPLIKNLYPIFKRKCDPELRDILPFEPIFKSDTQFLPLQAADMVAWLFRKAFNGGSGEWGWIATELMPFVKMSEYSSLYTPDRLENVSRLGAEVQFTPDELEEMRAVWQLLGKRAKKTL